ncbi:RYamide neuropeptides-like [Photinus pyralis]|nr:RYamide neuropeptides-like [Photinus pyralis]
MNAKTIFVLAAYFFTALVTVGAVRDYYLSEKKAQDRPFLMSSRYGRGGGGTSGTNGAKHVIVAPRTDKFFLASRYGKRSSTMSNAPLSYLTDTLPLCGNVEDLDLSCAYTGFSNLYRCAQKKETPSIDLSSDN